MNFSSQTYFLIFVAGAIAVTSCRKKEDIINQNATPPAATKISNPDQWMAIVGDSGATGAVASPRLKPKLEDLGKFIFDDSQSDARKEDIPSAEKYKITEDRPAPLSRVLYSNQELSKMDSKEAGAAEKATQKLDISQYSWGYLTGRQMGIMAKDIVMVAQDGTRVDSLATQFQRIKDVNPANLPPYILISYNANDLCDESVLTANVDETIGKYEKTVREQMEKALGDTKAHKNKTRIVVLAPLDVANVITNPNILAQKIDFEGKGEIECRTLREGKGMEGALTAETRNKLLGMCKAVLDTKPDDQPRIQRLTDLSQGFSTAWSKLVGEFNQKYGARGFQFEFMDTIRKIDFQTGDVANECFHPSAKAHAKIADQLIPFLEKLKN